MPYKFKDIRKRLLKLDYNIVRQSGSHVIFSKNNSNIIVPHHGGKDISLGVEKKIIKKIGLSAKEFKSL
ncbi:type II toxin-antitoxin system HicA family toxin [Candidatus Peregrinibacteria bacterium]|jgi:mRNA interferase HicA|nr:type II toxin-antitoxin system HicA family toxin [Candidatus Peregrinibacteria bacterium]